MVHTRFALPSQIRYEHLIKGRLIHVRIPLRTSDSRHLHVIGVYQKTHENNDKTTPHQRQQIWQALHKCLGQLPVRDSVVLLGDFNSPLRPLHPMVGEHVCEMPANPPGDVPEMEMLLRAHQLVVLNSWYPVPGGSHTFSWGKARSQIDFVITRHGEATTQARRVKLLHQFHVGAARKGGAYHTPLTCCLPISRPHWLRKGAKPLPCVGSRGPTRCIGQSQDTSQFA